MSKITIYGAHSKYTRKGSRGGPKIFFYVSCIHIHQTFQSKAHPNYSRKTHAPFHGPCQVTRNSWSKTRRFHRRNAKERNIISADAALHCKTQPMESHASDLILCSGLAGKRFVISAGCTQLRALIPQSRVTCGTNLHSFKWAVHGSNRCITKLHMIHVCEPRETEGHLCTVVELQRARRGPS